MYQDPNAIVTVKVSTVLSPFPSSFQQTGAILSFGGTKIPPNTRQFLTQYVDLNQFLHGEIAITTSSWVAGKVTIQCGSPLPNNITPGSLVKMQVHGVTPKAYDGIFDCTVTAPDAFEYDLVADPGGPGAGGSVQLNSSNLINAQIATYFRQGTGVGAYILELGYQPLFDGEVTALETWLNNSPGSFYGYLLPDYWGKVDNIPAILQLFEQFTDPEAMVYFWLTLDVAANGMIPKTCKCVIQLCEAPSVPLARAEAVPGQYQEFTLAAMFYWAMQFRATSVTRVAPMCFKYMYGVTPYPTDLNGPLLVSFKENAVNYIQTGAQGGIAYTNIFQGVTADGFDYFNWWWTIDWVQLNVNLDISNAVMNGANNPLAPLYYDQLGINSLEGVLANTMIRAAQYGMVNGPIIQTQMDSPSLTAAINSKAFAGQCNVNAVPFPAYTAQNPSDYGIGEYDGLSTLFIPSRGFIHLLVVVVATNIVTV